MENKDPVKKYKELYSFLINTKAAKELMKQYDKYINEESRIISERLYKQGLDDGKCYKKIIKPEGKLNE